MAELNMMQSELIYVEVNQLHVDPIKATNHFQFTNEKYRYF